MMQRLVQLTLDLFEREPVPPANAAGSEAAPALNELPPKDPERPTHSAIEKVATSVASADSLPSQTLQQALEPATFRHPRAKREALLDGVLVAYEFRRGKRRTIGFSVGTDGLAVSAPKWVPLYDIDKAVLEKSGWILKKLQESRERHHRLESARIDWKDGVTLPFLGEPVMVAIDSRHAFGGVGAELKARADGVVRHAGNEPPHDKLPGEVQMSLHVGLPHSATPEQIRDTVQAWLMRQAKRIFTERLDHFAPHLGVQWRKLSLSSAGTRWGSASADGSIRLNWRLIHFKQSVIDYVVVHELSHLRVMDHSPRFWDTVRAVVPDYAELRGQLKDEAIPRW
ncbi:MAG: SprT family zinc-dependent metalloprotease [Polaromonas sp.]|uniref:M48 family metallopeptidase n=1 Tax=Polaromonas sp. TaxID=1869339 RepID=UPI0027346617|nr:SprT family zinc-dependent metalloprotease [Polaromonas sp.]MDP3798778.1 SprT family zinc-dependent metalloprotease [Polaromonas sp.]